MISVEIPLLELAYYPRFHEAAKATSRLAADILGPCSVFLAYVGDHTSVTLLRVDAGEVRLPGAGERLAPDDLLTRVILQSKSGRFHFLDSARRLPRRYIGVPVALRDGRVFGVLGVVDTRTTEPAESELASLEALAHLLGTAIDAEQLRWHDPLTGVATWRLFDDRLSLEIERARRNNTYIAVVTISFDFPDGADLPGSAWWLTRLADRLRQSVRKGDTVARIGAKEFGVVMPDQRDNKSAARLTQTLHDVLADPLLYGEQTLSASPSLGVATFPLDGHDARTLLARSTAAMSASRSEGGNTWRVYSAQQHLRVVAHEIHRAGPSDTDSGL